MAISWDSVRSLVIFFGPLLLPKAIGWYRSIRSSSRGQTIQPTPPRVRIVLWLLLILAGVHLLKTLPAFAPDNVFWRTQSRLQIPVDVLFNRLATVRPNGVLTATDQALRAKFVNLESRLLYLQFGPSVLADCPFCNVDEPKSYYYYALPALLWPHMANLIVIAVVTSSSITGRYGAQWRTLATIGALALASLEAYLVSAYNYQANARALRLQQLEFFFWSMRCYRLLGLAALDAALGWVLYLSSTNRAFVQPPAASGRVDEVARALLSIKSRLSAVGIVNNTAMRDEDLRSRSNAYWAHEGRVMRDVMEEREVIEGINDALANRINIDTISRDAEAYTQSVLEPLRDSMRGE